MIYKTIEAVLRPDGTIDFPVQELPVHPVKVLVTVVHEDVEEEKALTDIGDYSKQLQDYEDRLARGEIQWQ